MKRSLSYTLAMIVLAGCTSGPGGLGGLVTGATGNSQNGQNGTNENNQGYTGPIDSAAPKEGAPIINAITTSPSNLVKGNPVTFDIKATDPAGKPLQFMWSSSKGVLSSTSGQLVSWTPPENENGVCTVQVIAISTSGLGTTASINLIVGDGDSNAITVADQVITAPGQKLPVLAGRLVANVGGDIALFNYLDPNQPPLYLTKNDIDEKNPALSPDGSRVAYIRNGNLYLVGIGAAPVLLDSTSDCSFPVWNSKGTKILYHRSGDKLYSVDARKGSVPGLRVGYYALQGMWVGEDVAWIRASDGVLYLGAEPIPKPSGIDFAGCSASSFAVDAATGKLAIYYYGNWSFGLSTQTGGKLYDKSIGSVFAYRSGTVYVTDNNAIKRFDEVTGENSVVCTSTYDRYSYEHLRATLSQDGKTIVYTSKNHDPRTGTDSSQLFAIPSQGGSSTQFTFEGTGVSEPSF